MKVEVPPVDELLALGDSLHKRGEPYESVAWGWPVTYTPAALGSIVSPIRFGLEREAQMRVGVPTLWQAIVEWTAANQASLWIERGAEPTTP